MPCSDRTQQTAQERPETRAERGPSGATIKKQRLKDAAAREGLSPALVREAQASLANALSLSALLAGKRA
jgi:hypothetical protein